MKKGEIARLVSSIVIRPNYCASWYMRKLVFDRRILNDQWKCGNALHVHFVGHYRTCLRHTGKDADWVTEEIFRFSPEESLFRTHDLARRYLIECEYGEKVYRKPVQQLVHWFNHYIELDFLLDSPQYLSEVRGVITDADQESGGDTKGSRLDLSALWKI